MIWEFENLKNIKKIAKQIDIRIEFLWHEKERDCNPSR